MMSSGALIWINLSGRMRMHCSVVGGKQAKPFTCLYVNTQTQTESVGGSIQ